MQVLRIKVVDLIPINSLQLAKNPAFHARNEYIEVHYHFVRERVLSGEVELLYVRTDRRVANIFTDDLGTNKLQHFSEMLGIQHLHIVMMSRNKN